MSRTGPGSPPSPTASAPGASSRPRCSHASRPRSTRRSRGSTTRGDDDFTIALLDALATRRRRPHLLPGAHRQRGLPAHRHRAALDPRAGAADRLRARPGVAAETTLAFTVDDAPGAPGRGDDRRRRRRCRACRVRTRSRRPSRRSSRSRRGRSGTPWRRGRAVSRCCAASATLLYLAGVATNLKAGDALLVVSRRHAAGDGTPRTLGSACALTTVVPDGRPPVDARVELGHGLRHAYDFATPATGARASTRCATRAALFGHNAPDPKLLPDATLAQVRQRPAASTTPAKPHWKFSALAGAEDRRPRRHLPRHPWRELGSS